MVNEAVSQVTRFQTIPSTISSIQEICSSDTCENDGACAVTTGLEVTCVCAAGFEGDRCEVNQNSTPIYIIVLSVAVTLFVIISLLILGLCFFIMRMRDKDKGVNFIYSMEKDEGEAGRSPNFSFGVPNRGHDIQMRTETLGARPLQDRSSGSPSAAAISGRGPMEYEMRWNRPQQQDQREGNGRRGQSSREASLPSYHERASGLGADDEGLYRGRPDMVPSAKRLGRTRVDNLNTGYF
ncbi:uncharacterized protein [Diadema setosum]|uniref:uncharacterized protein n=1 Tax=Diadema setosum TaxID=31175 RepID=UPI003B3A856E